MSVNGSEIVIAGGVRTPFGRFGGSLREVSSLELAERVVAEALARAQVPAEEVDGVVLGHVLRDTPACVYDFQLIEFASIRRRSGRSAC